MNFNKFNLKSNSICQSGQWRNYARLIPLCAILWILFQFISHFTCMTRLEYSNFHVHFLDIMDHQEANYQYNCVCFIFFLSHSFPVSFIFLLRSQTKWFLWLNSHNWFVFHSKFKGYIVTLKTTQFPSTFLNSFK